MDWTIATDLAYLAVTLPLIVWVAQTLSKHGEVFLADVFAGKDDLAQSVNRMLLVGFYLLNLGLVSLFLRAGGDVVDLGELVDTLSWKLGVAALTLGALHFTNVWVFNAIRRRTRIENARLASGGGHPVASETYGAPYPAR